MTPAIMVCCGWLQPFEAVAMGEIPSACDESGEKSLRGLLDLPTVARTTYQAFGMCWGGKSPKLARSRQRNCGEVMVALTHVSPLAVVGLSIPVR